MVAGEVREEDGQGWWGEGGEGEEWGEGVREEFPGVDVCERGGAGFVSFREDGSGRALGGGEMY